MSDRCEACGKSWVQHAGVQVICEKLQKIRKDPFTSWQDGDIGPVEALRGLRDIVEMRDAEIDRLKTLKGAMDGVDEQVHTVADAIALREQEGMVSFKAFDLVREEMERLQRMEVFLKERDLRRGLAHEAAADRAARAEAALGEAYELLAEAYRKLSGKKHHASDCATSNAPAEKPGPCDCDVGMVEMVLFSGKIIGGDMENSSVTVALEASPAGVRMMEPCTLLLSRDAVSR